MKMLTIAALLMLAPAGAYAQSATTDVGADAPHSKINIAVRADVAAETQAQPETPHTVGAVPVRSARVGERTVKLVDGSLPDGATRNPGS